MRVLGVMVAAWDGGAVPGDAGSSLVHVICNSKMMTTFVVPWAELELLPPTLQLSDSHFVVRCVCSAPRWLCFVVPLLVFVRIVLLGIERLFLFLVIYEDCAVKAVMCSFLNSVLFTACDCSSPLQEIEELLA